MTPLTRTAPSAGWLDVALRALLSALPRCARFRALAAYWARARRDRRIVRRTLPGGIDLELDLGDWVCAHLYYLGEYEPDTLQWLREACRPGSVVVEAGAHVGYFTVWCGRLVGPSGAVHAFEPWPPSRSLLERNVARNRATSVVVNATALSRREGSGLLELENARNYGTAWLSSGARGTGATVEITTLDAYASRTGLDRVDVIKIDVQGSELEVVEGMDRVLASSPEARVLIELDETLLRRSGASRRGVIEAFDRRGFAPVREVGEGPDGRPAVVEFRSPGRRREDSPGS